MIFFFCRIQSLGLWQAQTQSSVHKSFPEHNRLDTFFLAHWRALTIQDFCDVVRSFQRCLSHCVQWMWRRHDSDMVWPIQPCLRKSRTNTRKNKRVLISTAKVYKKIEGFVAVFSSEVDMSSMRFLSFSLKAVQTGTLSGLVTLLVWDGIAQKITPSFTTAKRAVCHMNPVAIQY